MPTPTRRPATAEEARALGHPMRLRVLRLCIDEARTNRELAERLGTSPGTLLHHVRTLVQAGFLVAEEERRGARGAREIPYRTTGKSWTLHVADADPRAEGSVSLAMVDAFRDELLESGDTDPVVTRLGVRLTAADRAELVSRTEALAAEFKGRDDPAGEPVGMLFGVHRAAGIPRDPAPAP